jgi:hypothetical protein
LLGLILVEGDTEVEGLTDGDLEGLILAEGDTETEGETEGLMLGLTLTDGDTEGLILTLGDTDGEIEALILGLTLTDGETEGLILTEAETDGLADGDVEPPTSAIPCHAVPVENTTLLKVVSYTHPPSLAVEAVGKSAVAILGNWKNLS